MWGSSNEAGNSDGLEPVPAPDSMFQIGLAIKRVVVFGDNPFWLNHEDVFRIFWRKSGHCKHGAFPAAQR